MSTLRIPVTDADHSMGPATAPVTVVQYGDYQCPYCGEAYPVIARVLKEFPDQVRFVFRNFPLAEIHPEAVDAAIVAEFAAEKGEFWRAHDLLYENQHELGLPLYERICATLGLSMQELREAAKRPAILDRIRADENGGIRSGVNGTPTFFINGERLDEGTPALESAVAAALRTTR